MPPKYKVRAPANEEPEKPKSKRVFKTPELRAKKEESAKKIQSFLKGALAKRKATAGLMKQFMEIGEVKDTKGFVDDGADDENPHPSDYSDLRKGLESGKKKVSEKRAWFYFYGGNGSGRLASFNAIREAYIKTDPTWYMSDSVEELDLEGKKLKKWFDANFDFDGEGNTEQEPTQMGFCTINITVKTDAERLSAIRWLKEYEKALEKVIF